ncbi:patatin-like phospholipase family protein [Thiomicrorhabdus sp.]|uniref:patatin-like phospholipase family protein n=1 Tax=Thiomicrorhabdus sp. TaxID=2039724 RepID=UPI0035698B8D
MLRTLLLLLAFSSLLSGCASYGVIGNLEKKRVSPQPPYSALSIIGQKPFGNVSLILAFSGGGSRAAALSYGVLQELRDTQIQIQGKNVRLLDEVDVISSVSGGSFTAAYYGLNGEKTFKDFEDVFLKKDIEGNLISKIMTPFLWFSDRGRTEVAVDYYEQSVFKGATFADLRQKDGPLIIINASDLGNGIRFSFIQEYFDLLCSDINSFPVARAVTASSSVPVVFDPVVIRNYHDCPNKQNSALLVLEQDQFTTYEMKSIRQGLQQYLETDKRRDYIHLVDGGITDNLGLRAIYEVLELMGGPEAMLKKAQIQPSGQFAVIAVNASTHSSSDIGTSNKVPDIETTINAVTDIQLHRYNNSTIEGFQNGMQKWSKALSTPEKPVTPYFIEIGFDAIKDRKKRNFFNSIPTSFSLTEEQIDALISAGRTLLRNHPKFQELLRNMQLPEPKKGHTRSRNKKGGLPVL